MEMNWIRENIFRNQKLIRNTLVLYFLFGLATLHLLFFAGIVLYIILFFVLTMSLFVSGRMQYHSDDADERAQAILIPLAIVLAAILGLYYLDLNAHRINHYICHSHSLIDLEGRKVLHNQRNSGKNPDWFSGNTEDGLLRYKTRGGAIGFGFPDEYGTPIPFDMREKKMHIRYSLSSDVVWGAILEGEHDEDLTSMKVFYFPAGQNAVFTLEGNVFEYLPEKISRKAKHLKMTYFYAPFMDRILISLSLSLGMNDWIASHYLNRGI